MKPYVCKIHGKTEYYEHYIIRRGKASLVRNCKQCVRIQSRKSALKDPVYTRNRINGWIEANREHYLQVKRKYRENNKEHSKEMVNKWKANNQDRVWELNRKRKAIKKNAPINDFTSQQWHELLAEYDYKCAYCHRSLDRLTEDHKTPLSRGGKHTKENIVPACTSCNCRKHDKTWEEFTNEFS